MDESGFTKVLILSNRVAKVASRHGMNTAFLNPMLGKRRNAENKNSFGLRCNLLCRSLKMKVAAYLARGTTRHEVNPNYSAAPLGPLQPAAAGFLQHR